MLVDIRDSRGPFTLYLIGYTHTHMRVHATVCVCVCACVCVYNVPCLKMYRVIVDAYIYKF